MNGQGEKDLTQEEVAEMQKTLSELQDLADVLEKAGIDVGGQEEVVQLTPPAFSTRPFWKTVGDYVGRRDPKWKPTKEELDGWSKSCDRVIKKRWQVLAKYFDEVALLLWGLLYFLPRFGARKKKAKVKLVEGEEKEK